MKCYYYYYPIEKLSPFFKVTQLGSQRAKIFIKTLYLGLKDGSGVGATTVEQQNLI